MKLLALAVADNLISVAHASLYHTANHYVGGFWVTVIKVLSNHVSVTFYGTFVLVEYDTLLVANSDGEVCCIEILKVFHLMNITIQRCRIGKVFLDLQAILMAGALPFTLFM